MHLQWSRGTLKYLFYNLINNFAHIKLITIKYEDFGLFIFTT